MACPSEDLSMFVPVSLWGVNDADVVANGVMK
jgi:hypothetical protein